jgi:hypothetical protein
VLLVHLNHYFQVSMSREALDFGIVLLTLFQSNQA